MSVFKSVIYVNNPTLWLFLDVFCYVWSYFHKVSTLEVSKATNH